MSEIELLAPAKNMECAMAAITHGADAVYIGGPSFGARAAAGNSFEDLEQLVRFAHPYHAKVFVTLNTILKDSELAEAERQVKRYYEMGVDALIVQDMGLLKLDLPPIAMHASTQMDNRTPEKVRFLQKTGFQRVVLARELSLQQIQEIRQTCDVELEAFVHGALCVSYSGRCYMSYASCGRSANRGECAQFCRLPFTLEDADGRIIERDRHLLSLKDMNRSAHLEAMMDAGVRSFKIEGRLKDVTYVKNITAYYRQAIDKILARRPEYRRASQGVSTYTFTPQPDKSFNRGFTDYYITGRRTDVTSFATPKSVGEPIGHVKEVGRGFITVSSAKALHNGDGLCYIDERGLLQGFRVNRVEGTRLFLKDMPRTLRARTPLFRNYDQEFERLLSRPSAERRIPVTMRLYEIPFGFALTLADSQGRNATVTLTCDKEPARTEQRAGIETGLAKLGGTILVAERVDIDFTANWFIPSSVVADMRRRAVEAYERVCKLKNENSKLKISSAASTAKSTISGAQLSYLANIANRRAADFYRAHGAVQVSPAFELNAPKGSTLMFCRHCLRYAMGWCPRNGGVKSPYREPYTLVSADGRRFALEFDCKQCIMMVKG